jgi:hypothetical protein
MGPGCAELKVSGDSAAGSSARKTGTCDPLAKNASILNICKKYGLHPALKLRLKANVLPVIILV